jgi:hypothetical protein
MNECEIRTSQPLIWGNNSILNSDVFINLCSMIPYKQKYKMTTKVGQSSHINQNDN